MITTSAATGTTQHSNSTLILFLAVRHGLQLIVMTFYFLILMFLDLMLFSSSVLHRPESPDKPKSMLLGSCVFVSKVSIPEHPPVCDAIERSCSFLNLSCCLVSCKRRCTVISSIYRSSVWYVVAVTVCSTIVPFMRVGWGF